jgi:hypothetical protein
MTGRVSFWELAGVGAATGGTGVWGLALAARVGLLRYLLEVFPRVTWEAVTWLLIPAMMLVPSVLQGVCVAFASDVRPAPVRRAVGGAVAGTLLAAVVLGSGFAIARVPVQWIVGLIPILPEFFVVCFGIALVAGWLMIAGRISVLRWLRAYALPLALAVVTVTWATKHAAALSIVDVLDQHEITGLFAAVAIGGAVGSVWNVCRPPGVRLRLRGVLLRVREVLLRVRLRTVREEP